MDWNKDEAASYTAAPTSGFVSLVYDTVFYSAVEIDAFAQAMQNNPHFIEELRNIDGFNMIRRAAIHVLSHEARRIVYRTPRGWWQMFKRDCFPAFLLRLSPVKEVVEVVEVKKLFPFPEKKLPSDLGRMVNFAMIDR